MLTKEIRDSISRLANEANINAPMTHQQALALAILDIDTRLTDIESNMHGLIDITTRLCKAVARTKRQVEATDVGVA